MKWGTVLSDYIHNSGKLYRDEIRVFSDEDAIFLRDNGIIDLNDGTRIPTTPKTVTFQIDNGNIGLRSIM